jgi:hypothetical protein
MSEKQEILERVLLLMKYDNKITLSENYSIISEQLSIDSIVNQGIDVNNSEGKNKKVFNDFLYNISSSNLNDLNKILSGINSKMGGVNKLNISSAIVANEIYYKKLEDYYTKKEKGEDYSYQYGKKTRITKPEKPNLTDVRLSPYSKSATEILQGYKTETEKKNKVKCPFSSKKDADNFRIWINKKYPKIAKEYDLSVKGPECNENIINASKHLFYIDDTNMSSMKSVWEYEIQGTDIFKKTQSDVEAGYNSYTASTNFNSVVRNAIMDKNGKYLQSDIDNYGTIIYDFFQNEVSKLKNISETKNRETGDIETRWNLSELKDDAYNIKIETYRILSKQIGYEKEGYSSGRMVDLVEAKSKEQILKDYFEELKKVNQKLQLKSVISDVLDSPNYQRLYGTDDKSKKFIEDKIEECGDSATNYFEELAAGQIRNRQGKVVGSLENGVVIKPDSNKIPCTNEFWEKWGGYIQLGTIVGAAILSAGLSLGPTAAFILEATVDTAVNYYALKKSVEKGDKNEIKMNLAYLMLPFLMRTPIVKQGLMKLKYGSKTIESVESKLNQLRPGASKSEINQAINTMTNEEKAVLVGLQKPGMKKVIESATQETINGLKQGVKMANVSNLPEPIISLFAYAIPVAGYFGLKMQDIKNKFKKALKREPTDTELRVLAAVKEKLKQQQSSNFFEILINDPKILESVVNSNEMKESVNTVAGFKGKSEKEIKETLKNTNLGIENIIEKFKEEYFKDTNNSNIQKTNNTVSDKKIEEYEIDSDEINDYKNAGYSIRTDSDGKVYAKK